MLDALSGGCAVYLTATADMGAALRVFQRNQR